MDTQNYVIITPARNEEAYIEKTIQSVISQTILPRKWVIVSDGSTDRTDEIVNQYVKDFTFIELLRAGGDQDHNFGSKVNAFNAGYETLGDVQYDYIGNLDADVSFDKNYFERIIEKFEKNNNLGIGGGIILELVNGKYITQNISLNSVAGAVQLFRRTSFEAIDGYLPLEYGGIDAAAEILARAKGWQVQTFPELEVLHHRRVITGQGGIMKLKFRHGINHYLLGYSPLFEITRCLWRITERPFFVGHLLILCGFFWGYTIRNLTGSCRLPLMI